MTDERITKILSSITDDPKVLAQLADALSRPVSITQRKERHMLNSAAARLAVRAVIAGALVFFTTLQTSDDPLGKATLLGAASAGFFAALEILTPVNRTVGVGSPK